MLGFNSQTITTTIGVAIILVATWVSTTIQQAKPQKSETLTELPEFRVKSQIITVGPLWNMDSWAGTSYRVFMMHGALRGLANALLTINISNEGMQSLYSLEEGKLESFSIGIEAGNQITITRTGTVTGFLTVETAHDANASCTAV